MEIIDLTSQITINQGISNICVYLFDDKYYINLNDEYLIAFQHYVENNVMYFLSENSGWCISENYPTFIDKPPPFLS
jgi:hypothetical protein